MRILVFSTALGLAAGMAASATAHESSSQRGPVAAQTITADALKRKIDQLGYDVARLKFDDGVFEARIVDRASGGIVSAHFNPADGELIRARLAH